MSLLRANLRLRWVVRSHRIGQHRLLRASTAPDVKGLICVRGNFLAFPQNTLSRPRLGSPHFAEDLAGLIRRVNWLELPSPGGSSLFGDPRHCGPSFRSTTDWLSGSDGYLDRTVFFLILRRTRRLNDRGIDDGAACNAQAVLRLPIIHWM